MLLVPLLLALDCHYYSRSSNTEASPHINTNTPCVRTNIHVGIYCCYALTVDLNFPDSE